MASSLKSLVTTTNVNYHYFDNEDEEKETMMMRKKMIIGEENGRMGASELNSKYDSHLVDFQTEQMSTATLVTSNQQANDKQLRDLRVIFENLIDKKLSTSDYIDNGRLENIDLPSLLDMIQLGLVKNIEKSKFVEYVTETCYYRTTLHIDYGRLASRYYIYNLHSTTSDSYLETCQRLMNNIHPKTKKNVPLLDPEFYSIVVEKGDDFWQSILDYDLDYQYDYFGMKTLESGRILSNMSGKVIERPQHMILRMAIGIYGRDYDMVKMLYNYMSQMYFTFGTPTLFNAGTPLNQLASCFIFGMLGDSIEGIYETLKNSAMISKSSGGVGIAVHRIRANNSIIRGSNGISNGLVPMIRNFNETARYVDQGGGKRKGSFALYLEPWHADIFDFLDLKKPHGKDERRARDLYYGLWNNDLFMERIELDQEWSLFCPDTARNLYKVYGDEFEELYTRYEREGLAVRVIKARELWKKIVYNQIEFGFPYMLYKDPCNEKSNQKNLGTIQSSNLCAEIVEYFNCEEDQEESEQEVAVCNLASVSLPAFVNRETMQFDHQKLFQVTSMLTKSMNQIIDVTHYCIDEARNSNMRHRPIGIGVQGLANLFHILKYPFDSVEARQLNRDVFETIYFAALTSSNELAKINGPYESFEGSPASKGILQYHMWGVVDPQLNSTQKWDWAGLIDRIVNDGGLRNSLTTCCMPTASSSQILSNNEGIEPFTDNLYVRSTLSGDFVVVNEYLFRELCNLGLWSDHLRDRIIQNGGSINDNPENDVYFPEISDSIKLQYRTVWELPQKSIIDMSADRGVFVDQSQSLTIYMKNPTYANVTSMHFYGWKKKLKTGMYYMRIKSGAQASRFSLSSSSQDIGSGDDGNDKIHVIDDNDDDYDYDEIKPINYMQKKLATQSTAASWFIQEKLAIESIKNKDECLMCQG